MLHRTIEYNVAEVEPGLWRWIILAGVGARGEPRHRSREAAVEACIEEINNGIERTRSAEGLNVAARREPAHSFRVP